ncbi:MAG: ABC transporter substrate-binding protein [Synergistaceae bacterium]|jgi:peptide/nickel transport system substrate-binding protein|nr:ABC transporter substrate-binding protein [Synergistaceae bacterium]
MRKWKSKGVVLWVLILLWGWSASAAVRDTLIVADQYDATTMDPVAHNDLPSTRACLSLYDTLIFVDSEGEALPGLAESWEFLSDTQYKMTLRRGVLFHNGEEMKAEDVKFSLERAMGDKGSKVATYSQNLEKVEALDDYTVVIYLKEVDYSFFLSLTGSWACIVNKKAVEAAGEDYGMQPVGTGPFKFVSWQKGNKYVLERFDAYWGPKVRFRTLEVRSVPEPSSRTIELEAGGADLAFPIIANDMRHIEENLDLVLYREPQTSVCYMGFNVTKKPFDDIRVRKAISAALDTVAIQKAVWRGTGKLPTSLIPFGVLYSLDGKLPPHRQDVEEAKRLLAEAGIKDLKLEIWTNERKERVDSAMIMQAQLLDVGITAEIKVLEWGAFLNGLRGRTHDLFILGWPTTIPDPNFALAPLLEGGSASNYTFINDPKIEELLAKGRSIPNGREREAIYGEIQRYVNDQVPMIYVYGDESTAGSQKYVRGFKPKLNEVHSVREVYFEE